MTLLHTLLCALFFHRWQYNLQQETRHCLRPGCGVIEDLKYNKPLGYWEWVERERD